MRKFLDQLDYILSNGEWKQNRTGVRTIGCFGMMEKYDLSEGFPVLTTRKFPFKSMVSELLWFISGSDNINDLKKIYPHNRFWDLNAKDYWERKGWSVSIASGRLGRIYGRQWRKWNHHNGIVDQLQDTISIIREDPNSRRIIVNAWNPGEVGPKDVALPPCHCFFQFSPRNDSKLDLLMYQRSCDMFLGVPINIASYALLLHLVSQITYRIPGTLTHVMGDAHIYENHIEQVKEQLTRQPHRLPKLFIRGNDRENLSIDKFVMDDIRLVGYKHHPKLTGKMAV